ncbi:transcriptional regulator, LacI family [Faunimonas pinastri]|uniref:Transcriptional regulator, LacI family n=1 Tax=Faunimonas pinastri TaxID=1855383 RepID=A0A1H9DZB7_9HYPH|nr:LacI family DNA-binding transcriptional regulator [Faunimonas pinastri]SEQ18821.1 transcriptional regulator, LacI family [Faunimonas pinastri]
MRSPTIRDVAKAAGLSVAAVSRHLNRQIALPDETARRIDDAVQRLGYQPNVIARRLSRGSSETLAFITSDIAYPFFAAVASAAEAEAAALGYSLLIFNSRNEISRELSLLSRITDHQVDGAILMTNHVDDGQLGEAVRKARFVVLADEDVSGADVPRVFADNETGGALATRHLIATGHHRIAFIGGPRGLVSTEGRLAGFEMAMKEAGLPTEAALTRFGFYSEQAGAEAFRELMSMPEPPTAIFAIADLLAVGVISAAREMGVTIPDDLSVVSFDDIPYAHLLNPPLTTVHQSADEFGRVSARLLVDLIHGRSGSGERHSIPVKLIERGSVSAPPRSSSQDNSKRRQGDPSQTG